MIVKDLSNAVEFRNKWDKFVLSHINSTNYHQVIWKDIIEKTFGHKTYYLFALNDEEEIEGILPLVHMKSILFGNFLISLPFFNYGGLLANGQEAIDSLIIKAKEIGDALSVEHIELRHLIPLKNAHDLKLKTHKVTMLLELPDDPDILWKRFKSKLRSQIRRPQKEGMSVKIGGIDQLDSFYEVFSINMRDLGTPVYPKKFFLNILKSFPKNSWIVSVFYNNLPVASGFIIGFKDVLEIPWASSIRKYNRLAPNMLLYWSILEFACKKGFKKFDFGRSSPNKGTYRFKKQWGATPHQLYWYYWLRNKEQLPSINPDNPKYKMAIELWQKLPVGITKILGPMIVKYIP